MNNDRMSLSQKLLAYTAIGCCFAVPALSLAASLFYLHSGWDDGAITLAYARTWWHTGTFALTPISPVAEGTSSLLWTSVMGAASLVTDVNSAHSNDALLAISKITSAACFCVVLSLFYLLAGYFLEARYRDMAVIVLSLSVTPIAEIANGMEMTCYAMLVLVVAVAWLREQVPSRALLGLCILSSALIVMIRFESIIFLPVFFAGLALARPDRSTSLLALVATDAVVFTCLEAWRWLTFDSFLPNTILAKRWPPYTIPGLLHQGYRHFIGLIELPLVFAGPVVGILLLLLISILKGTPWTTVYNFGSSHRGNTRFLVCMSTGALVFGLSLGYNWGAVGRMGFAFAPFVLLLLVFCIQSVLSKQRGVGAIITTIIFVQAVFVLAQLPRLIKNAVPVSLVEAHGRDIERIRLSLERPSLSVMIPDIGGTALCCQNLRLLDTGLLGNQTLAHQGYGAIPELIQQEKPDMIETHGSWAHDGRFYSNSLLAGYKPVIFNDLVVFLKSSLAADLLRSNRFMQTNCRNAVNVAGLYPTLLSKDDINFTENQPMCLKSVSR